MKNIILLGVLLVVGLSSFGQKGSKYESDTLRVYGNCGMCEDRIEEACDVIGVKRADWNEDTGLLTVLYNPSRIALEEIHQLCADVGHSTSKVPATDEAYSNLHHCCKYVIHEDDEHDDCEGKCGSSCTKKE